MSGLYNDLEVSADADEAALKRARNKAAKRYHPDSGTEPNPEKFDRAQRSYMVLSDPQKRADYDRTGSSDGPSLAQEEAQARSMVAQAITGAAVAEVQNQFGQKAGKVKVQTFDVRKQAEDALAAQAKQAAQKLSEQLDAIERLEEVGRRLRGGDDEGVLRSIVAGQIAGLNQAVPMLEGQHRVCRRAVEIVAAYEYVVDKPPPDPSGLRPYHHITGFSLYE